MVYKAFGKLSNVYQKFNEQEITFANRVRELEKGITGIFKQEYEKIINIIQENENLKQYDRICKSFKIRKSFFSNLPNIHSL